MVKCHYEYKGQKYDELADLYPIILGEAERQDSVTQIPTPSTEVITIIDTDSSSPIKEVPVNNYLLFTDNYVPTDQDLELAKTSIESGDYIEGKDLLTKQGKFTIKNYDERTDQLFTLYDRNNSDILPTKIGKDTMIKLVALNQAYEKYIQGEVNNSIQETTVDTNAILLPGNIEQFMKVNYISDTLDPKDIKSSALKTLSNYGFDPNRSGYLNLQEMLYNITINSSGIREYYSDLLNNNVEKFQNLEIIIDTELPNRGRATIRRGVTQGDVTSIRLNPTLIDSKESLAETLLEELTHAIVYSQIRNPESTHVKRLQELQRQAIVAFGEDKLRSTNFITEKLKDLNNKLKAGINLTEEENAFYDIHRSKLNSTGDDRIAYRLNNFDEFVAGVLVDKRFQDFLNNIEEIGSNKTLWQKFIDFVTELAEQFGLKNNGLLKYAIHDSIRLVENSLTNTSSIGESLNGKYSRSKTFAYNKLGLKDENGVLKSITNAEEVARFINRNFNNLVAINNPETNAVQIYYRDELNSEKLSSIDEYLNSYDPFDLSNDSGTPEFLNLFDASGFFNDDTDQRDVIKQFGLQTKVYLSNLNDRLNSLFKSKRLTTESMTEEVVDPSKVTKLEKIDEEIATVGNYIKRLTTNNNRLKGLVDLYYQGVDELEKIDTIMKSDMNSADIKYTLQTIKFWKDAKKFIFTPNDYTDTPILELYNDVEAKAQTKMASTLKVLDNYVLNNVVKKHTKFDGTVIDLAKEFVDLSQFRSLIDDLGVTNSTLLNSIASEIKNQNEIRQRELVQKLKRFKDITKEALPALKNYATNSKDTYEIFRQIDKFGRNTRNVVNRYSYEYQKERKILNFVYDNSSDKTKEDAFNATLFLKNNTEKVDIQALFPENEDTFNQEMFDKESARLKELMGTKYFSEWFGKQQKKLEEYKKYKEYKIANILDNHNLTSEEEIKNVQAAYEALEIFNEANNPYLVFERSKNLGTENPYTLNYNYQSFKYVEDIPKKKISSMVDGKLQDVEGYDSKFTQIEKDDSIYNYYNEIVNILKEINTLIPYETGQRLATNGLPEFKLEMYDLLMDKGMKAGWDAFGNSMADMIRTEKFDNSNKEIDIVTGKQKQNIRMGVGNSNSAINNELQVKILKYKIDTASLPTDDMIEDWRSEITEKYANEMDFDLSKVMQRYIILGMAYKHKSIIEDSLILSQLMFDGLKEYQRDNKGDLVRDVTNANAITYLMKDEQDSFVNSKKMLDHTIRSVLFNDSRKIDSGKKKVLSPAEKRHKEVLENTIAEADIAFSEGRLAENDYKNGVRNLQRQIDALGAYSDKEKYWDLPLKWTQYKGMGWNIVGGISNMVFGYASNLIESAGAEFYTGEELAKAYNKVIMNSSVRNATFNKVNRPEALKIRNLMDHYDIMAESGREYKSLIGKDITEKMKWLSAFNVNARTEYINQAPLMVAMLDKTKFEHNGKEYSLYEGFDDNGEWSNDFGEFPEELMKNTVLKIKALIQRNHGNYNPMAPVLAKRTALGRLLLQFRTWMLDGFRTRFFDKDGRYDHILETTIKGRYISAYDVFRNDWKGATLGTALQVIKNLLPYSNRYLKNWTPLEKMLQGNDNIKDYDIANMRRLAMEINMFIGMYTVVLTMSMLAGDWDDDDPRKWAANLLLNQGSRLRSDILMYINPVEAKKLIQDPIPSMKILTDYFKFQEAVKKTVIDGSPEYETGMYEGHNRMLRTGLNMFPLVSQPYKTGSNVWQVFDDK